MFSLPSRPVRRPQNKLHTAARHLDTITDQLEHLGQLVATVRRNPLPALLVACAAGYWLVRSRRGH